MKYYIIAGEASGDLHASNLMKEIRALDSEALFRCWGGDLMEAQGGLIVKHYRQLAFMGFIEVVTNLPEILNNLRFCKKDIEKFKPDALILVDYPGFNLRIAEFGRKLGLKVFYYISPQVWAWKRSRVKKIRRDVDRMFVILPFEKDFYAGHGYDVEFVGHPLIDVVREVSAFKNCEAFRDENGLGPEPIIAILPGSRKQEINKMLPIMLSAFGEMKGYQAVVAAAPSIEKSFYEGMTGNNKVKLVIGHTHDLLRCSYSAMVTSGTATLETALFGVPQVVCYKGSYLSYQIARRLVKVRFISLVNLVADRMIVTELIQSELTPSRLRVELEKILKGPARETMLKDYKELNSRLGESGSAARAASGIVNELS